MPVDGALSPSAYRLFVGVDIAAATFTAVWMAPGAAPGRPLTLDQTPQGFAVVHARLLIWRGQWSAKGRRSTPPTASAR